MLRQIGGVLGTLVITVMAAGGIYVLLTTTLSEHRGTSALVVSLLLVGVLSLGIVFGSRNKQTVTAYW